MSARNTGLFVRGHLDPGRVARLLASHPAIGPGDLAGDERPRVGHGRWKDQDYTLVALRLFEVGGLLLLDTAELPPDDELERALGQELSRDGGLAVYLHYDEERGAGGFALFRDGVLVDRRFYDGRDYQPVVRDLLGERPLQVADEEAWIWEDIGSAVELGAGALFGPGIRTDDDLAALIEAADAQPVDPPGMTAAAREPGAPSRAEGPGLRRMLRRLAGRSRG